MKSILEENKSPEKRKSAMRDFIDFHFTGCKIGADLDCKFTDKGWRTVFNGFGCVLNEEFGDISNLYR
jgi:hypothetical protein